jgi:2-C-methyl-D-erythritol 4-phosphate cytidylyltransferase
VWTIVVAAGSGDRFGGPKQFALLGQGRVLDRSVGVATRVSAGVVVVVPAEHVEPEARTLSAWGPAVVVTAGGPTRSASVRAGLAAVPSAVDVVCVHDAARPLASEALFRRVIDAVGSGASGAVPGLAVTDTVKVVDALGVVTATPARETLRSVQTPQAFRAEHLRAAHAAGAEATDDASLVERIGPVLVVEGDPDNRKLTMPSDLVWAQRRVAELGESIETAIGAVTDAPADEGIRT